MTTGFKNSNDKMVIADDWGSIAVNAAKGGHKEIFDSIIHKCPSCWTTIVYNAAKGGHKEIFYDVIKRGFNNYTLIATAAKGNHFDIVEDMLMGS